MAPTPPACGVQGWLGALKSRLSDQIYQISPPLYLTNASGPNLLQNFEYKITWQCLLTIFLFCVSENKDEKICTGMGGLRLSAGII